MTSYPTPVQIEEAASAIRQQLSQQPAVGLVLGSGLSSLAEAVAAPDIIDYDEIPHWPASTVPGHSGRLVNGRLEGQQVLVMQGRAHYYEGYGMHQITFPVRVMNALGIETMILTNAAGGINPDFSAGDLMLIRDHLNFPGMAGWNPLRGPNDDAAGPRFPDMTHPYDAELRELAHAVAAGLDLTLQEGTYAYVAGPSYETPAELRFLKGAGADAVGMSTVPSVVVARHAGLRVLGISTITNIVNLDPRPEQTTTHEEVLEVGALVVPRLTRLLHGVLARL
mgnify:CR=1 FL=1